MIQQILSHQYFLPGQIWHSNDIQIIMWTNMFVPTIHKDSWEKKEFEIVPTSEQGTEKFHCDQ